MVLLFVLISVVHLDEKRKEVEGYKSMADTTAGKLPHYLLLLYYKIIEQSLLKHSKRPSVMQEEGDNKLKF